MRSNLRVDNHAAAPPRTRAGNGAARIALVAGLLGAFLLSPTASQARVFYVSPSGSDSQSGRSADRPWRTLRRVNRTRLWPGDTVLLRGGAEFEQPLMPRWSGRPGNPIAYGSYGDDRARLPRGIWFRDRYDLSFDRLVLPGASVVGRGDRISLTHSAIARGRMGVYAEGDDWTIHGNHVHHTGDSGLILSGLRMTVDDNTIERTGRDRGIRYGKHGIYLRVADARVTGNTIRGFADNGISARRRNGLISGNRIDGGPIGIAWFQNDHRAGTSEWTSNSITRTTAAGIYVSPADAAGTTRESFVISRNLLRPRAGRGLDLRRIAGLYRLGPSLRP